MQTRGKPSRNRRFFPSPSPKGNLKEINDEAVQCRWDVVSRMTSKATNEPWGTTLGPWGKVIASHASAYGIGAEWSRESRGLHEGHSQRHGYPVVALAMQASPALRHDSRLLRLNTPGGAVAGTSAKELHAESDRPCAEMRVAARDASGPSIPSG
jgi:hypothetical protein